MPTGGWDTPGQLNEDFEHAARLESDAYTGPRPKRKRSQPLPVYQLQVPYDGELDAESVAHADRYWRNALRMDRLAEEGLWASLAEEREIEQQSAHTTFGGLIEDIAKRSQLYRDVCAIHQHLTELGCVLYIQHGTLRIEPIALAPLVYDYPAIRHLLEEITDDANQST